MASIITVGDKAEDTFPWLRDATEFVQTMGIATPDAYVKMKDQIRDTTFTVGGVDSISVLYDLKQIVADAVKSGQTVEDTKTLLLDRANIKAGEAERVVRDTTKAAYLKQWRKVTEKSGIKSVFGYVKFISSHDGRTRATHRAMDGFICSVDDPAYKVMLDLLAEPQCRCTCIALTQKQAEAQGVSTEANLPDFDNIVDD
jgi:SPP1 gp7 family putative phage head morphogenesis protein